VLKEERDAWSLELKKMTESKAWASANVFPLWGWALYCGTAYFLSLDAKQAQILRNEKTEKIAQKCINIGLLR
jgi:hypothetical protein